MRIFTQLISIITRKVYFHLTLKVKSINFGLGTTEQEGTIVL